MQSHYQPTQQDIEKEMIEIEQQQSKLSLKDTFKLLAATANKIVVPSHYPGHTYFIFKYVWQDRECIVLYSRKKGSHWNTGGSHWYYLHDAKTGEFLVSFNGGVTVPGNKERLLKADLVAFNDVHKKAKQAA